MKKILISIFSLVLLIGCSGATNNKSTETKPKQTSNTEINPKEKTKDKTKDNVEISENSIYAFEFSDYQKNQINKKEFIGKNIYVNIMRSWCPHCIKELPEIIEAYNQTKNSDNTRIIILASPSDFGNSNEKNFDDLIAFFKEKNVPLEMLWFGKNDELALKYGVRGVPSHLFFNQKGILKTQLPGEIQTTTILEILK